jgi:hypothetical protein
MHPSVPACVVPTQIGKPLPAASIVALGLGELVGFSEHAEDGHAVDALRARERGEPPKALQIQRPIVMEGRWRDVEHGCDDG